MGAEVQCDSLSVREAFDRIDEQGNSITILCGGFGGGNRAITLASALILGDGETPVSRNSNIAHDGEGAVFELVIIRNEPAIE